METEWWCGFNFGHGGHWWYIGYVGHYCEGVWEE